MNPSACTTKPKLQMKMLEKRYLLYAVFLIVAFCSCQNKKEKYIHEIRQAENDFAQMASDSGIPKAFLHFAAKEAILMRNNKLIKGHSELLKYFSNPAWESIRLEWEPSFIDVAKSGDLAYTYGNFVLFQLDSTGQENHSTGVFHTVWKRQEDGSWKFVWD